ncbi:MAG: dihydroorotate dehydrogenase electron transfer subunit [Candidatus Omnitrophota bacterium]
MKKKMFQEKARVISNAPAGQDYYRMSLLSARIAAKAVPGQFLEVQVSESGSPLLRRPFGIHSVLGDPAGRKSITDHRSPTTVTILYEIRGKGTAALAEKKPGDSCDILGPLGNGFTIDNARYPILVAGGMGVAPLVFLAEQLSAAGRRLQAERFKGIVLIGGKTRKQILCKNEFEKSGHEVKISTDDGSLGHKGYVTDLLDTVLSTIDHRPSTLYACGPQPMLKEVSRIAGEKNIPAQLSLEEHMACGIGACLGCVVKTTDGYKRVCKDGPVFDSGAVKW